MHHSTGAWFSTLGGLAVIVKSLHRGARFRHRMSPLDPGVAPTGIQRLCLVALGCTLLAQGIHQLWTGQWMEIRLPTLK